MSFRHNLADRSEAETLLVRLSTSDGRVGHGQILPRAYLTGETLDGALADVRDRWWPRLREIRFENVSAAELMQPLYRDADADRRTAGYAGVDVAARAALGYFGAEAAFVNRLGRNRRVELVGVVPATGVRKAGLLAGVLRMLGYRRFKVKVGTDAARDAERLAAVRRAIGTGAWLAADANGAWGVDEARERMREMGKRFRVKLVEEPVRADVAGAVDYKRLEAESGVEAMADESLCTIADAEGLIERGSPSWWNVRLAKNGGFMGVNALAERARKAGVKLYGGILVGEAGALAAAGRMAFFEAGVECGEYGFSRVFLKGDPYRGVTGGYFGTYRAPVIGEPPVRAGEIPGEVVFSE